MTLNEFKKSLRSLSSALADWGNVKNPRILNSIIVSEHKSMIKYSIGRAEPLIFINAKIDRHCLPTGIEKLPETEVMIKLTSMHEELIHAPTDCDPLNQLGVNIIIDALYVKDDQIASATCSWHLDRHDCTSSNFTHPIYHINFGGSHMESMPANFGNLLLLNSPRVIHPPLDIILGCDFILKNFYPKASYKTIVEKPAYKQLIKFAKERYWRPFAMAFVSEWYEEMIIPNLSNSSLIGL